MCHKNQICRSAVQVNKTHLHSLLFFCGVVWTVTAGFSRCAAMYHILLLNVCNGLTVSHPIQIPKQTATTGRRTLSGTMTEDVLDKTSMSKQCYAPNLFRQLLNVWLSPAAPWKRYSECGSYKLAPLSYHSTLSDLNEAAWQLRQPALASRRARLLFILC